MTAIKARMLRILLFACVLALGMTLVRGVTGMLEEAVYGAAPERMAALPSK